MALTPEHKAAMKAGRVRAAEARKLAAKSTVGMAAGHERDEQRRVNADVNEERLEKQAEAQGMEAIDESKFRQVDREIMDRLERSKGGVQNAQPGYFYFYAPVSDAYKTHGAKAAIRDLHEDAKRFGCEPVREDMPEDKKFKGNDHAAGSSLRGKADCILYRQPEEAVQATRRHFAEKERKLGMVEEQTVVYAQQRGIGTMHAAAGDFKQDPLLSRIAGEAGREETYTRSKTLTTNFTEGDMRRGSMRGPDGRTLQPGFETRTGR